MAKASLYNLQGANAGFIELNDVIFALKPKVSLIHQVYTALRGNAREPWADTKNKGEVRGGGKKPWAQKGTGRARHGSTRSPIWKGGGVTFGPLSIRNYKRKVNKQMSQIAVKMCLSDKVANEMLVVIESFPETGKSRDAAGFRANMPAAGKSTLLLVGSANDMVRRAVANLPSIDIVKANDVNVVDLLHHQAVIATKEGINQLEKRFL